MENKKQTYVIEHLEPKLFPWCLIEYKSISKIVGKSNLWFTNIKQKDKSKLEKYGKVFTASVKSMKLDSPCILNPEASQLLIPKDSDKFKYFIFGGILGDYPPRKRTTEELTKFVKGKQRHIGKQQFSTDNAVYVVHEIAKGKKMNWIKFKNKIKIRINDIESIILPYYYPLIKGNPRISTELIKLLKNKKEF